jgi:hypothetical protein
MASPFSKRLQKLEEAMASRLNQPIGTVFLEQGETKLDACVRAGYDPAYIDQVMSVRWLDPEKGEAHVEPELLAGPPDDPEGPPPLPNAHQSEPIDTQNSATEPDPSRQVDIEELIAARERYDAAIRKREAEIVTEKLQEATRRFGNSIV